MDMDNEPIVGFLILLILLLQSLHFHIEMPFFFQVFCQVLLLQPTSRRLSLCQSIYVTRSPAT